MSYATTKTVKELTLESLVWNLEQIQEGLEFKTTVGTVKTVLAQRTAEGNWPKIFIVESSETVVNHSLTSELLVKSTNYVLLCVEDPKKQSQEAAAAWRGAMLADIERKIGLNWSLEDADGNPRCRLAMVTGSAPFPKLEDQVVTGIAVKVRVDYAQDIHDPTQEG